ncbi:hypothetical protein MNEG_5524 [Monoraphidium neglectum]|uniref:Coenzyme Q-binding protein COQ10 START domain-containing protein n=1 Tax=Monoraphidium neglectum TaxID=145388 RepID=A0A0D2MPJ9_9CHLO|nr:hypothetical protein MNEG_5524 [Monoraphidium neglectum]KIZ02432.1 hypothetical protein MNEG_5524 [Monoraphidium neglectum]|eukprot:XP_013901451.1 hypothetical protein MNEG_5524 [Monoraphidium neglectum]
MGVLIKGLRGPSGEFGALGVVEVNSSAVDVFRFVADVEQQPTWHHGVKHSKVIGRNGNQKDVHQVLSWNFLALRGDMHLQLAQLEDPKALTIKTELTKGTMMRNFRSRVGVRQKAPGKCELEMEMFVQPNIFVPFGIRGMVGGQVRRQLRGVLSALQEKCERRSEEQQQQQPPWQPQWQPHWQPQWQQLNPLFSWLNPLVAAAS